MQNSSKDNIIPSHIKLAQSASALGALILGFGLGIQFGENLNSLSLIVIVAGAVLHGAGMYVVQIKNRNKKKESMAKLLYVSAWGCLVLLILTVIYILRR